MDTDSRGRRGQGEIVIIFAVFVVAVVVIVLLYNSVIVPSQVPENIRVLQSQVASDITDMVHSAALLSLNDVSSGGSPQNKIMEYSSTRYNGEKVPYWQMCGQRGYPQLNGADSIASSTGSLIEEYVKKNIAGLVSSYKGRNVAADSSTVDVDVNILDNRMEVSLRMEVSVEGYPIRQSYSASARTKLKKMYEFAKDFVDFNVDPDTGRVFERNVFSSMVNSNPTDDRYFVPVAGGIMDCSEEIFKTWNDLEGPIEYMIDATFARTSFFKPICRDSNSCVNYCVFCNDFTKSSKYGELHVRAYALTDYEVAAGRITPDNFGFSPNPISVKADPIKEAFGIVSFICEPEIYYINYYLNFPSVVVVTDPETGYRFYFGVMNSISGNQPEESCGAIVSTSTCNALHSVKAKVRVVDDTGSAVDNANVLFGGCPIGTGYTDMSGRVSGTVPPEIRWLRISKEGHASHEEIVSADSIEESKGKTVVIDRNPEITFKLYTAEVTRKAVADPYRDAYTYTLEDSGLMPVSSSNSYVATIHLHSDDTGKDFSLTNKNEYEQVLSEVVTSAIEPGTYNVSIWVTNPVLKEEGDVKDIVGQIEEFKFTFSRTPKEQAFYVYLPVLQTENILDDDPRHWYTRNELVGHDLVEVCLQAAGFDIISPEEAAIQKACTREGGW